MPKCPFCAKVISAAHQTCPYCRAPITVSQQPQTDGGLDQRVRALLDQRQKLAAIKLYREETGASLLDAKSAVEALEFGTPLPATEVPTPGDWEGDVLKLLGEGKKIQAIKLYREHTGGGLKEAKEAVEALGRRHGVVGRGGGCLGVVLLFALAAAVVATTITHALAYSFGS